MRAFETIKQAYEAANKKLVQLLDTPDRLDQLKPVESPTPAEMEQCTHEEQEMLRMRQVTHQNLMKQYEETLLFREILYNFEKMEAWFSVLSAQKVTFNRKGFAAAEEATRQLRQAIESHRNAYLQAGSTTAAFTDFAKAVGESIGKYQAIINANHDILHDTYRDLQRLVQGLLKGIEAFFNAMTQKMGFSKEQQLEISSWIKPEETTRSLFTESILRLGSFFTTDVKKLSYPSAESQDATDDKAHQADKKAGV